MIETFDPNSLQTVDVYNVLTAIEFMATVCAIALAFIVGMMIWFLIMGAKNEKRIW